MRYFKWQSEDQLMLMEKFIGKFTSDFIQLSEEFLLDYDSELMKLNLISDLTEGNFAGFSLQEANQVSRIFLRNKPKGLLINYGLVIGTWDRPEKNQIESYMDPLKRNEEINLIAHDTLDDAYKWLNLDFLVIDQINEALADWQSSSD